MSRITVGQRKGKRKEPRAGIERNTEVNSLFRRFDLEGERAGHRVAGAFVRAKKETLVLG